MRIAARKAVSHRLCPNCGRESSASRRYCSWCGTESVQEDLAPASRSGVGLNVVSPDGQSHRIPISEEQTLTVGRSQENDICLDDPQVSRHTRRVRRRWLSVTDLYSTNGTFLGDSRLLPGVSQPWPSERSLHIAVLSLSVHPIGLRSINHSRKVLRSYARRNAVARCQYRSPAFVYVIDQLFRLFLNLFRGPIAQRTAYIHVAY